MIIHFLLALIFFSSSQFWKSGLIKIRIKMKGGQDRRKMYYTAHLFESLMKQKQPYILTFGTCLFYELQEHHLRGDQRKMCFGRYHDLVNTNSINGLRPLYIDIYMLVEDVYIYIYILLALNRMTSTRYKLIR